MAASDRDDETVLRKVTDEPLESPHGTSFQADRDILRDGLSIGALSKATGISIDSLRMWERRYGAPKSYRLPSGHRRYPNHEVQRLRAVAQALSLGYRAGQVADASIEELRRLLLAVDTTGFLDNAEKPGLIENEEIRSALERWITIASRLDDTALSREFYDVWAKLGPMRFIEERAVPFLHVIGEMWEQGELCVMDEHFASERLNDFLTNQWRRLNERIPGRPILLASLPGDLHRLGLTMCALMVVLAERRVVYIGPLTPPRELLRAAERAEPVAVCISISSTQDAKKSQEQVMLVREKLDPRTPLIVGGNGAPGDLPKVEKLDTLLAFYERVRTLPA
ncbi:MAG: MerR family transcriptional regulator [Sumerlaeia bacterium]